MKADILTAHLEAAPLPVLYSRAKASAALNISVRKLDYLIASGKLASIRIDGRVLVSSWELLSFIEQRTVRGVQSAAHQVC